MSQRRVEILFATVNFFGKHEKMFSFEVSGNANDSFCLWLFRASVLRRKLGTFEVVRAWIFVNNQCSCKTISKIQIAQMCKLPRNYFCFGNRKIGPCPEFRSYFRRRKSAENKKESKLCTRSCMRFSPIPKSTHIPSNFAPENPRITSIFELWACIKVCWTLLGFFIWLGDPKCNVLLRPFFSFRSLGYRTNFFLGSVQLDTIKDGVTQRRFLLPTPGPALEI